jgi:hypothetical protein
MTDYQGKRYLCFQCGVILTAHQTEIFNDAIRVHRVCTISGGDELHRVEEMKDGDRGWPRPVAPPPDKR